jgi:type IV secretory pathway TraG/TraD family ATPase VirD4
VAGPLHFAEKNLGEIPVPRFKLWRVLIGYFIVCWGLSQLFPLIGWKVSGKSITDIGNVLVILGTCYPLLIWVIKSIFAGRVLTEHYFRFPLGAQFWYAVVLFWVLVIPVSLVAPSIFKSLGWWNFALLFGGGFVVLVILNILKSRPVTPKGSSKISDRFGLYLGTSTGVLGRLSHGAAIRKGQNVVLGLQDAAQNILVLGGIGSGKTTRAVQPLLVQLFDQDSGGLIFDIKGDFKRAVEVIAHGAGRSLTVIGPEKTKMNLISGLSPEVAASFLKSALLLNSRGAGDPFWIDTAAELCKNALGVLSFFPKRYSLSDLHEYLFDPAIRNGINEEAQEKLSSLPDREKRLLKTYLSYYEVIFSDFDDRVKKGVNASVSQILSPFNHPDLVDAFCTDDEQAPTMEKVLDGTVYLVDMPLARWGLGGKVAYNFIKLRFFNVMQRRNTESGWNHERPVFFMCDEFQEIVSANRDGLSDLNFWDKSRSSKCIGIISAQAVSSFYAAIGQRDISDALLQNFRQKICFKTEDSHTIEMLNHLLGRVEVERQSFQQGEGSSSGGFLSPHFSSSSHESVSRSVIEKQVINPQLFRTLGANQAVTLLSFAGVSADDVIECVPVFID